MLYQVWKYILTPSIFSTVHRTLSCPPAWQWYFLLVCPLSACPLSKSDCMLPAFLLSVCLCLCVKSLSAACLSTVRYFCVMFASLPITCLLAVDISFDCQPVSCLPIACLPIDCLPFFLNACVFSLSATFLMLAVLLPPVASQTTWMSLVYLLPACQMPATCLHEVCCQPAICLRWCLPSSQCCGSGSGRSVIILPPGSGITCLPSACLPDACHLPACGLLPTCHLPTLVSAFQPVLWIRIR